ncbi:MAG: small, acid-soluble spore protein, alpha/beta type [Syntrophomonadaceae bacterium]|nr:small, acid-soluble spore protein, alpha/beta type [Syntrophomonadaceae bacterium]
MGRNRNGIMSDELKWELAKELGVDQIVAREGFGGVTSRDCGNLVKMAIMRAEQSLSQDISKSR